MGRYDACVLFEVAEPAGEGGAQLAATLVGLIPVVVGAVLGALLGHVYRLRGESIRALSDARTEWLASRYEAMWAYVQQSALQPADRPPGRLGAVLTFGKLGIVDPRGAGVAEGMIQIHALAIAANAWQRRHDPLPGDAQAVFAPQVSKRTAALQSHLALWALVSWRMPTWRLKMIYHLRQLPIEKAWIIHEHSLRTYNAERDIAKRDRRVFRTRGY